MLADEIRIFEGGVPAASHAPLEGRGQKRLDPAHRKRASFGQRRQGNPEQVTLTRARDHAVRRSLDFYAAVGRRLAARRSCDECFLRHRAYQYQSRWLEDARARWKSLMSPGRASNAAKSAPSKPSTPCSPKNSRCAKTAALKWRSRWPNCRRSRRSPTSTSPSSPRWTRTASCRSRDCSSGTGKTHLSLALGVEAVKGGRSVYFSSLADIVAPLAKAERDGALRERIRYYCRFGLLIVDEIGYLPVTPGGGNLFFQLVNARYEKGAMILPRTAASPSGERSSAIPSPLARSSIASRTTPSSSNSRVELSPT